MVGCESLSAASGVARLNSSSSLQKVSLATISTAHFVNHVFLQIHLALIPVFMNEFSISLVAAGLMVSIPMICETVGTIPSGLLADRTKHINQVIASLSITAVAATLTFLAPNFYAIVGTLSLLTIATTLYHPPAYSLTAEIFPRQHRSKALGVHGAGGTLGFSLGPISLGILMATTGWRFVYLLWVAPVIVCIVLLLNLKGRTSRRVEVTAQQEELRRTFGSVGSVLTGAFALLLVAFGINTMGRQVISSLISSYLVMERGISVATASVVLGLISAAGIVAAPLGGFLGDRIGDKRWLTISYLGTFGTLLGIAYASTLPQIIILALIYGAFGYSGMGPSTSLVAAHTPTGRRGLAYALYFLPQYSLSALAPTLGAIVAQNYGIWNIFPLALAMILAGTITLVLTKKTPTSQ